MLLLLLLWHKCYDCSTFRRDDAALCLSTWRDSLWLSAFRWTLSHLGPLGLAALPALARLSCSGARRRMGEQLRACVSLAAMALLVHFLLALPSLIQVNKSIRMKKWTLAKL